MHATANPADRANALMLALSKEKACIVTVLRKGGIVEHVEACIDGLVDLRDGELGATSCCLLHQRDLLTINILSCSPQGADPLGLAKCVSCGIDPLCGAAPAALLSTICNSKWATTKSFVRYVTLF